METLDGLLLGIRDCCVQAYGARDATTRAALEQRAWELRGRCQPLLVAAFERGQDTGNAALARVHAMDRAIVHLMVAVHARRDPSPLGQQAALWTEEAAWREGEMERAATAGDPARADCYAAGARAARQQATTILMSGCVYPRAN